MSKKIDALVAERVLRWSISEDPTKFWRVPSNSPYYRHWNIVTWPHCPTFSANIADAWEVRASLKGRGIEVTIGSHGGLGNIEDETCILRGPDEERWEASAKTAELAICLAALRAVGGSEPEIEEAMR